jgi:hypothetical protein
MPRRGVAGSGASSSLTSLRSLHADFHSGCTDLHPTSSVRGSLSPHLTGVCCWCSWQRPFWWWDGVSVSFWLAFPLRLNISLCTLFSESYLSNSFARLLIQWFVLWVFNSCSSLYILDISPLSNEYLAKTSPPSCGSLRVSWERHYRGHHLEMFSCRGFKFQISYLKLI